MTTDVYRLHLDLDEEKVAMLRSVELLTKRGMNDTSIDYTDSSSSSISFQDVIGPLSSSTSFQEETPPLSGRNS